MKNRAKTILFFIIEFSLIALCIYGIVETVFPSMWPALKSGDEKAIEEFLVSSKSYDGLIYLFLLQVIQIVSVVLPSGVICVAGGFAFGIVKSLIVLESAIVLTNTVVFVFAKKMKNSLSFIENIKWDKVTKAVNFIRSGDNSFVVTMLSRMAPGIANGIVPYVAATTDITTRNFAIAILIGSFFPTISSIVTGRLLLSGEYIWAIVAFFSNFIVIWFAFRKRKDITELVNRYGK